MKLLKIPDWVNCNAKEIIHCDYYMHEACKKTCAYAKEIKGITDDKEENILTLNDLDNGGLSL